MHRVNNLRKIFLIGNKTFTRSIYAEALLEDFFVAAVASVLIIRLLLRLANYPRIELPGLHISHVLLGGLLMLLAIIILLSFLDHEVQSLAAVIGGIGFGAFVDELGKFITSENDYFFEPTIALIYIIFVLLFFSIRFIGRSQVLSGEERIANFLELVKQSSITGLEHHERQLAIELLEQDTEAPFANDNLRSILLQMPAAHSTRARLLHRLKYSLDSFYKYLAVKWWFTAAMVAFFAIVSITPLAALIAQVQWSWGLWLWLGGGAAVLTALAWSRRKRIWYLNVTIPVAIVIVALLMSLAILGSLKQAPMSLVDWAQFVFPSISGVMVAIGLLMITLSRLRALKMLRNAVLISIFFTQVFAFYAYQLLAVIGMMINIFILLALRYLIDNEEAKLESKPQKP